MDKIHTATRPSTGFSAFKTLPPKYLKPNQVNETDAFQTSTRFSGVSAVNLNGLPEAAKYNLQQYFQELLGKSYNAFGYVFWGHKPMAFSAVTQNPKQRRLTEAVIRYIAGKGTNPAVSFRIRQGQGQGSNLLFVIDRTKCQQMIAQHLDDFQRVSGKAYTPSQFVDALTSDDLTGDLLLNDNITTGILLGYGKGNAIAFDRFNLLGDYRRNIPLQEQFFRDGISNQAYTNLGNGTYNIDPLARTDIPPSPGFTSTQAEYDYYIDRFGKDRIMPMPGAPPLPVPANLPVEHQQALASPVELPGMQALQNTAETLALRTAYLADQKVIEGIYNLPQDDFIIAVLSRLLAS